MASKQQGKLLIGVVDETELTVWRDEAFAAVIRGPCGQGT